MNSVRLSVCLPFRPSGQSSVSLSVHLTLQLDYFAYVSKCLARFTKDTSMLTEVSLLHLDAAAFLCKRHRLTYL